MRNTVGHAELILRSTVGHAEPTQHWIAGLVGKIVGRPPMRLMSSNDPSKRSIASHGKGGESAKDACRACRKTSRGLTNPTSLDKRPFKIRQYASHDVKVHSWSFIFDPVNPSAQIQEGQQTLESTLRYRFWLGASQRTLNYGRA